MSNERHTCMPTFRMTNIPSHEIAYQSMFTKICLCLYSQKVYIMTHRDPVAQMVRAPDSSLTGVRRSRKGCTILPGISSFFFLSNFFHLFPFFFFFFFFFYFISLLQDKFEYLHSCMTIANIHINLSIL